MQKRDELAYIEVENSVASAKIALQGAHIFDYTLKGKGSVLFLSDTSVFKEGKAIRGGIPICWPWFGANEQDNTFPNHGFARTSVWHDERTQVLDEGLSKVTLSLESTKETFALWPHAFKLTLDVYVGNELRLELRSQNVGTKPFTISSALHTYLTIDDISKTTVDGLEGKSYFDKTQNAFAVQQGDIDFSKEVDRIYKGVDTDIIVNNMNIEHNIHTEGTETIVVWNPAEELASNMADLANHTQMLCVESANVLDDTVTLEAGESHTLTQTITTTFLTSQ